MRVRRLVGAGVAAAVTGATLIATGGTASAAPAATAITVARPDTAQESWQYYDWYWTYGNCATNGGNIVARRGALDWRCEQSPYTTWYLYLLR